MKLSFTEGQWRFIRDILADHRIALAQQEGPPEKTLTDRSRIFAIEAKILSHLPMK